MNTSTRQERTRLKILVAFEEEFCAYRQTLAATIGILRPEAEVTTAEPEEVGGLVERSDPDIVICSRPKHRNGVRAWIELPIDPTQPTKVRVDGRYSEMINPTLDAILAIVDEVERLTRTNDL